MSNLIIPEDAADPADMPHDAVFEHCEAVAWGDYDPSCEPYSRYLSGPEVVTSPDRVLGTEIVRRVELGARDSQGRVVPWERRSALKVS